MGMNMILTIIMGITMSTIVGTTIAPSIIEQTKINKVNNRTIKNQEVIFEAIKRYTTMKQETPEDIDDLFSADYIDEKVNDNGFGEPYSISVDKAKGVATITTIIKDSRAQETFLKSFKGVSKPSCTGNIVNGVCETNEFETKYVIPNDIMHGNALLMTGIPISSTPPTDPSAKYWYDTSTGKAILKLYDGTNWVEVNLGGGANTQKFEPGDYNLIRASNNNFIIGTNSNFSIFKQFMATRSGTLRFLFEVENDYMNLYHGRFVVIAVNGVAVGTPRAQLVGPVSSSSTYVEDISFNIGDTLEIRGTNPNAAQFFGIRTFKIMSSKETIHPLLTIIGN